MYIFIKLNLIIASSFFFKISVYFNNLLAKKCIKTFEKNLFSFFAESVLKYNCHFKK